MNTERPKPRKKRIFRPRASRIDRDLIDRLREVIESIGSNHTASKAIERSEGAVRKWLRGESEPSASDIRRLCETSGHSAEWVLFGTDLQGRCEREHRVLASPARLLPVEPLNAPSLETLLGHEKSNQGDTLMESRRAREILNALVQGSDPLTREALPEGTILDKADVVRAILAGIAALDESLQRESRRSQLPSNIGKSWSDEENTRLVEAFRAGVPIAEIAANHGRTLRAIEARLEMHGLITGEERTTADRFGPNAGK